MTFASRHKVARDEIDSMLRPYGFDVSLQSGGKHHTAVCKGPIVAKHSISMGTGVDQRQAVRWARRRARNVIRQLQQGRA